MYGPLVHIYPVVGIVAQKENGPGKGPILWYAVLRLNGVLFGGADTLDVAFVFVKRGAENVAAGVISHKIQIIKIGRRLQNP